MTKPVETSRKPFFRGAIIMCVLAVALSVGIALQADVRDAIAKTVSGPCAKLDTTRLDPLNPAQRACYCEIDGGHDVCRMMITGSIR
ncbi:MAG: hypothetical protein R3D43_04705 [Tepidamorphaceae bacterium]|nr:hypothetical protein [Rhodobiaceae bacterium]MCC0047848.1 hypothetical protein [Rhodobiaceae bacterium]